MAYDMIRNAELVAFRRERTVKLGVGILKASKCDYDLKWDDKGSGTPHIGHLCIPLAQ